jgi:hypothetical protein
MLQMKKVAIFIAVVALLTLSQWLPALTVAAPVGDREIVKALDEQNRHLARIAESLERISGQRPGWKLP